MLVFRRIVVAVCLFVLFSASWYWSIVEQFHGGSSSTSIIRSPSSPRNHTSSNDKTATPSRPVAFLHVGPRKTGTTSIQTALFELSKRGVLSQDNYVFLGKPESNITADDQWSFHNYIHECMGLISEAKKDEEFCQGVQQWIHTKLQEHASQGHNLIWSDEDVLRAVQNQPQYLRELAHLFQDFEIKVVVGYRLYYEWILSEYYQEQKQGIGKHTKHRMQTYRPFWEWYKSKLDPSQQDAIFFPLDAAAYHAWKDVFANMHVFNLHHDTTNAKPTKTTGTTSPTSMVDRFICQNIPNLHHTCVEGRIPALAVSVSSSSSTSKTKKNVADHRIPPAKALVQEAIHQGWIPLESFALASNLLLKTLQESESKNTSTGVLSKTTTLLTPLEALPLLVAPTELIDLAAILERSQDLEALFGGGVSGNNNKAISLQYPSKKADLKKDFDSRVVKPRIFSSVNASAAIQQHEEWKSFLSVDLPSLLVWKKNSHGRLMAKEEWRPDTSYKV